MCDALFERAASELAAEQYSTMLRTADDRMRLCPGPQSAFLLGLAQANLVDSLALSDPAEREQTRRSALRNLRIAAAGADLKTVWQFTVHDWIVHLQSLGPADAPEISADAGDDVYASDHEHDLQGAAVEPLHVPAAPPPQPQPVFPWGPVLTGVAGLGALTAGLVLGLSASSSREEARDAAQQLRALADDLEPEVLSTAVQRTRALNEEANSEAQWSTVFLVAGAAAMVGSIVWYVALPPEGKWRWAATPTGVHSTLRF